eukprot:COSAG01_NODE_6490_length_3633_cov_24.576401_6_plen_192_part_01
MSKKWPPCVCVRAFVQEGGYVAPKLWPWSGRYDRVWELGLDVGDGSEANVICFTNKGAINALVNIEVASLIVGYFLIGVRTARINTLVRAAGRAVMRRRLCADCLAGCLPGCLSPCACTQEIYGLGKCFFLFVGGPLAGLIAVVPRGRKIFYAMNLWQGLIILILFFSSWERIFTMAQDFWACVETSVSIFV